MMNYYGGNWAANGFNPFYGMFGAALTFLLIPLMIWGLFWKGWALWKAAKADSKPWFIALLIINTVGILEILYIFVFSRTKKTSRKSK